MQTSASFGARRRLNIAALSAPASHRRRGIQIGPRIRIGGTVGKIGQNVKNAVTKGVTDVGHAVGDIASNPWVEGLTAAALAATGVGAPAAAGIMAAERGGGALLKPGGNLRTGLTGAATGAALGYGASKVGDLLYDGVGGVGAEPVSGAAGGLAGIGKRAIGTVAGTGGGTGGGPGGVGGAIESALGLGGPGGLSPLDLALAGLATAQGVNAAKASARAGQYQDKALNLAESNWAAGAPLRAAGVSGLMTPPKINLSSTYANPANPFAVRKVPLLGSPGGVV